MTRFRGLSDDQLLAQCRFEAFRGPGPGGQKRNKTSSAVRLTHRPSGLSVIAGESRSQHRNRQAAMNRLRHQIAVRIREPIDPGEFPRPSLLGISRRSDGYPAAMGMVLDVMACAGWSVSDAADILGVTTARLVRFLQADEKLWTEMNQQRQKIGLRTLN
ncbi:MAG TPA: peptide chain release factor-like protein [Tepidisphaeraceae bacterium]|nr:peptide chain release factor-like protein [Tepidisphaeraceae bacterium]